MRKIIALVIALIVLVGCQKPQDPPVKPQTEVAVIFDTGVSDLVVETIKGQPGDALTMPSDPIREGYQFKHWTYQGEVFTNSIFPEQNIILTAVWEKFYTITFDTDEYHEPINDIKALADNPLVLPVLDSVMVHGKSYKFLHWTLDGNVVELDKMPAQDIILVAVWEEVLAIMFDTKTDTVINPITLNPGDKVSAPHVIPEKAGHVFRGWTLNGAPYIFNKMPETAITLEASYLPLDQNFNQETALPKMFINLENNYPLDSVTRESYVNAQITITSEAHNLYAATSEFKGRGHGSWTDSGPKKGYRLKFSSRTALFDLPSNKHWVLLAGANFYDPTLAKNPVAFNLARDVFSNIEYTTSTNWVELYINGEYRGVYVLAEHVRVDKDRVNVKAEFGPLDTGYLIEYDAYGTEEGPEGVAYFRVPGYKYPFVMKAPDFEDYLDEGITLDEYKAQVNYISNYINQAFTAALNKDVETFESLVDIDSFIDMYLLHELLKNTDTGWSSFYMYKKPGGKLYAGPAWDFDASQGKNRGDTSPYGYFVSETVSESSPHTASELYINLMQAPQFKAKVMSRWQAISSQYKAYINDFLSETFTNENKLAFGINYYRWSNQGPDYGLYLSIEDAKTKWTNDTNSLRTWIIERANWFDGEANK